MAALEDMKHAILVVDDEADIRELVSVILESNGFEALTADCGAAMDVVLDGKRVDLIILDSMMPGEDGLSICKRLQQKASPPVIMLSAKSGDVDKIRGLVIGADDYMVKPFNGKELVSRIRAVLRRVRKAATYLENSLVERVFGWSLDCQFRKITSPDGLSLFLSTAEFAILRVFLDHPDGALERGFILKKMAELHQRSTVRALDTLISRLRSKLERVHPSAVKGDDLIRTVYGTGYMLRPKD